MVSPCKIVAMWFWLPTFARCLQNGLKVKSRFLAKEFAELERADRRICPAHRHSGHFVSISMSCQRPPHVKAAKMLVTTRTYFSYLQEPS